MNINGKRIDDLIVLDVLNVNGFRINYIEQNARSVDTPPLPPNGGCACHSTEIPGRYLND